MLNWLKAVWSWASGKKTYILSFLVVLIVLVLLYLGQLTPELAMAIALVALGLFAATFRSALAAHSALLLQMLTSVAAVGIAARQHNKAAELTAAGAAAEEGAELGTAIAADKAAQETKTT